MSHFTHSTKSAPGPSGFRSAYILNAGLSLCIALAGATPMAWAQEAEANLGIDQDSLLPPEVVPLDPAAAQRMTQSQAQSRAAGMSAPGQSVPGMSSGMPPQGQTQSAQEFRKDMYNSLYNQGNLAPNSQMGGNMQGQPGMNQGFGSPQMANQGFGQQQPGQLGQSGWTSGNGAPEQAQPVQQKQTLSGAVQQPNTQGNNKFNGAKHILGTAAGLGGGIFVGAMMMRNGASSPAAAMGMGLLGASLLNAGMRSAFRF